MSTLNTMLSKIAKFSEEPKALFDIQGMEVFGDSLTTGSFLYTKSASGERVPLPDATYDLEDNLWVIVSDSKIVGRGSY